MTRPGNELDAARALRSLSDDFVAGTQGFEAVVGRLGDTGSMIEVGARTAFIAGRTTTTILDVGTSLIVFDSGGLALPAATGGTMWDELRTWRDLPISAVVLSQRASDKTRGMTLLLDAYPDVSIVAQENYRANQKNSSDLRGFEELVIDRQFQGSAWHSLNVAVEPTTTYLRTYELACGPEVLELHAGAGETNDQTWLWAPDRKIICAGDFVSCSAPNAGNPQRPVRYAHDWAMACREMADLPAEILLAGHWLPIFGKANIKAVLEGTAEYLEHIHEAVVSMMNLGRTLDEVLEEVRSPRYRPSVPFLPAVYDDPEFVARNVWRHVGGWYGGRPSDLRPPTAAALGRAVATLVEGGAAEVARQAAALALRTDEESIRVACALVDIAADAAPQDVDVHVLRADIYERRARAEATGVGRGIFIDAANTSRALIGLPPTSAPHSASGSAGGAR